MNHQQQDQVINNINDEFIDLENGLLDENFQNIPEAIQQGGQRADQINALVDVYQKRIE